MRITLLESGGNLLNGFDRSLAEYSREHLISRGVNVRTNVRISAVKRVSNIDKVVRESAGVGRLRSDTAFAAAGFERC